jgi:protease-4
MKQFFKFIFATFFGILLFLLIAFITIVAVGAAGSGKVAEVKDGSILKLSLNYEIPDKTISNPLAAFDFSAMGPRSATGLNDLIAAIDKAAKDNKIKGIYLQMGVNPNGWATLEMLRERLIAFKKSGKVIYAYGVAVNQRSYYLASVADKVYLDPNGGLELTGFGRQIMYFKGFLDKAGIEVQAFHVGTFKSAIEPFMRTDMSPANREQLLFVYGDIYSHMLNKISDARKIDTGTLKVIIDSIKAENAYVCKELKLIDDHIYYDQVEIDDYADEAPEAEKGKNKVAVVYLEGDIVDGNGKTGSIGGDNTSKLLRELRNDEDVKAVVLRVNSPGGSAVASDLIWREVTLLKAAKKPVVVSFGNVAASGGYYISCAADRIFAEPTTITGSIGVFGLIPNFQKLLNDKLGVTVDEVELSQHAVFGGGTKPIDAFEGAVIQRGVERVYSEFKQRVAQGRGRDTSAIEAIAQGRVWTGNQGVANGLVDEVGNLDKAIAFAIKKGNLKDYKVSIYPEEKSLSEKLSEGFGDMKTKWIKEELGAEYAIYKTVQQLKTMDPIQCRVPMEFEN